MSLHWTEGEKATAMTGSMTRPGHPIPDKAGLRQFGLMFAAVLAAVFGLLIPLIRFGMAGLPLLAGNHNPAWPWWAAAVIAAFAVVIPGSLVWLYKPWMKFADVAQWVNSRLILLLLFYVIILPMGLLRRLLGKDSMQRKFDAKASSYRTLLGAVDHNDMEKPF
jgi:hypothetical protein